MADSIRQKIVDAVVARMQLINGSGSYVDDRRQCPRFGDELGRERAARDIGL
jgi:hypothetical protein